MLFVRYHVFSPLFPPLQAMVTNKLDAPGSRFNPHGQAQVYYNGFGVNLTQLSSLACTDAVTAAPDRGGPHHAARCVGLIGELSALLYPNWGFRPTLCKSSTNTRSPICSATSECSSPRCLRTMGPQCTRSAGGLRALTTVTAPLVGRSRLALTLMTGPPSARPGAPDSARQLRHHLGPLHTHSTMSQLSRVGFTERWILIRAGNKALSTGVGLKIRGNRAGGKGRVYG